MSAAPISTLARTPSLTPSPNLDLNPALDLPPDSAPTLPLRAKRNRKPWSPSHRDHLIFRFVTFQGYTQDSVAKQFDLHQTTVSRCLERYQRWIARGGPATTGSLSPEERLRYQRWLTYERNELVLGSALRIATEMERSLDVSKSVISRPTSDIAQASEIRTEHSTLDRSGTACRFLRLAHKINMDQLKLVQQQLVQQQQLDPLEPLSEEDFDPSLDEELDQSLILRRQTPCPQSPTPTHPLTPSRNLAPDLDLPLPVNPVVSYPGSSLETPSPEAPASSNPYPAVVEHPVVEGSPDPSTPPTAGLTKHGSPVATLELTPSSPPELKTHKTHAATQQVPSLTPITPIIYDHSPPPTEIFGATPRAPFPTTHWEPAQNEGP